MQNEMSPQGTIELQRATNTLVLRDRSSVLEHLLALLRDFDHPRQRIEFEVGKPLVLALPYRGSDASGLVVAVTVRSPREDGLGAGD